MIPDIVNIQRMTSPPDRPTRSSKRPKPRTALRSATRARTQVAHEGSIQDAKPAGKGRAPPSGARKSSASAHLAPPDDRVAGQLLIAMPSMTDPRFAQTVIYICAHNDDGAMGLVLNRPLAEPRFADLIGQLDITAPSPPPIRICAGGPVEPTRGFVLHSPDWQGDDTLRIDAASALSTSIDVLRALATGAGPTQSILALGYAGWGSGQLDAELHRDSWLVAPATSAILFDAQFETKWRRALGQINIDPAALSGQSGRA